MRTMTILVLVVAALGLLVVGSSLAEEEKTAAEEKQIPAGQKVFMEQKCQMCHTVYAAGIGEPPAEKAEGAEKAEAAEEEDAGPPDLSLAGDTGGAEWMSLFLKKEESLNGKKHMKRFKGTDEELAVLVDWLSVFKTPEEEAADTEKPAEMEKASEKDAPSAPEKSAKPGMSEGTSGDAPEAEKSGGTGPATDSSESQDAPESEHAEKGHEGCGH